MKKGVRIEYSYMDNIGGCFYIGEASPYIIKSTGKKIRRAAFQCKCGYIFISAIQSVRAGQTTSCGCAHQGKRSGRIRHGLSTTRDYTRWIAIKQRCLNKNHPRYSDYGGRGISINSKWINDFLSFHDYIARLPGYGVDCLTLDRIDNDGNYEPGNLRFTSYSIQNFNRRRKIKE